MSVAFYFYRSAAPWNQLLAGGAIGEKVAWRNAGVCAGAAQELLQLLVVWGHAPVRGYGYHPAPAGRRKKTCPESGSASNRKSVWSGSIREDLPFSGFALRSEEHTSE